MSFFGCSKDNSSSDNIEQTSITFIDELDKSKLAVKQTQDGGYILGGQDDGRAWMSKLNENGIMEWENTYSLDDHLGYTRAIIQTQDGGYLYAGWGGMLKPTPWVTRSGKITVSSTEHFRIMRMSFSIVMALIMLWAGLVRVKRSLLSLI